MTIDFDWDNQRARANIKKHGVSFKDATTVFDDPFWNTAQLPLDVIPGEHRVVLRIEQPVDQPTAEISAD